MARTPRKHPKPNLRKRGDYYELRWYWAGKLYEIRLGNIKKQDAEVIRDAMAVAFAGAADFPEEVKAEPALKRYLALQAGITSESSDATLIAMYVAHLHAQNPESIWYNVVKYHLNSALSKIGTLQNATTRDLQTYLDAYAVQTSGATSNRARTALSGFFKYLRNFFRGRWGFRCDLRELRCCPRGLRRRRRPSDKLLHLAFYQRFQRFGVYGVALFLKKVCHIGFLVGPASFAPKHLVGGLYRNARPFLQFVQLVGV